MHEQSDELDQVDIDDRDNQPLPLLTLQEMSPDERAAYEDEGRRLEQEQAERKTRRRSRRPHSMANP